MESGAHQPSNFSVTKTHTEMVGAVYPPCLKKIMMKVLIHGKECAKILPPSIYDTRVMDERGEVMLEDRYGTY